MVGWGPDSFSLGMIPQDKCHDPMTIQSEKEVSDLKIRRNIMLIIASVCRAQNVYCRMDYMAFT